MCACVRQCIVSFKQCLASARARDSADSAVWLRACASAGLHVTACANGSEFYADASMTSHVCACAQRRYVRELSVLCMIGLAECRHAYDMRIISAISSISWCAPAMQAPPQCLTALDARQAALGLTATTIARRQIDSDVRLPILGLQSMVCTEALAIAASTAGQAKLSPGGA